MVRKSLWFARVPESVGKDPLNRMGKRTVRNSSKLAYNCAGYALKCFSWYCPQADENTPEDYYAFETETEAWEKTINAVEVMLNDFPTLRMVHSLNEVRPDEYAILFRLSHDGDFHYLRRDHDNHWRHKMGNSREIETIKTTEIWEPWGTFGRYDGPIVILAKQR